MGLRIWKVVSFSAGKMSHTHTHTVVCFVLFCFWRIASFLLSRMLVEFRISRNELLSCPSFCLFILLRGAFVFSVAFYFQFSLRRSPSHPPAFSVASSPKELSLRTVLRASFSVSF